MTDSSTVLPMPDRGDAANDKVVGRAAATVRVQIVMIGLVATISVLGGKMERGGYNFRSLKRDKFDYLRISKKHRFELYTRKDAAVCNEEETSEPLISGDLHCESNQGVFGSELSGEVASNLSKSVVSLALLDGDTVLFVCSGIAVECNEHDTRLLTSARLLKAFNDERKDRPNLKVEVHHEDTAVIGSLREYNLNHNIAAVSVANLPDLCTVSFKHIYKILPHSKVVAVGRDISGKLMATNGLLISDSSGSYNNKLRSSTCKFSEIYEGGPLFDFDGNFVGMNLAFTEEGTLYVPGLRVLEQLEQCILVHDVKFSAGVRESPTGEMPNSHQGFTLRDVLNKDQFGDLESLGYPEPPKSMLDDGLILVNTFEESFGDVYGEGVWSELSEAVVSNICENIVALASFKGEKRVFACTGFFIEWNEGATILTSASLLRESGDQHKIVENLRIEVLLPNKQRTEGTVQHYSFRYNVALVCVKDYRVRQPAKIQFQRHDFGELLAVGCVFKSGRLMATKGVQVPIVATHDCKYLYYCACRITKAGIGGPLLDFNGNFIGMNFYDEAEGTLFLSWREMGIILNYFKTKGTTAEHSQSNPSHVLDWRIKGDNSVFPNSWLLPKPYWCYPEDLVKHKLAVQIRNFRYVLC
uniref:Uncharacterized protein n=1 Tax=Leersia perrieri TaxID=77586 RepID=A0A0D9XYJ4_9ORYZ